MTDRKLLRVLSGEQMDVPPVWLMRQAGRYLPEYRATRRQAGSFLDLCYTPELACEVTLQPIRRFGFDAAILFSDILVIPDGLGQDVRFVEGTGPVLDPLDVKGIDRLAAGRVMEHLLPVFKAVSLIRGALPDAVTLIGFCGAPWTVATYMVGGKGSPDQAAARLFARSEPEAFQRLIDILVEASVHYLAEQVRSGADCLQVFDTWAGSLDPQSFERWCVEPMARIVAGVRRALNRDVPFIGFPKGRAMQLPGFAGKTMVNGVGLDWSADLKAVAAQLPAHVATQGNIDPLLMVTGGPALDEAVDRVMEVALSRPHIVNLGHGITPQGNPAHVEQLIARVRETRR